MLCPVSMLVAACECLYAHVGWVTHHLGFHPLLVGFASQHAALVHFFATLYRSVDEKEKRICNTHLNPVEE
jgi:hypothetical protein